MMNSKLIFLALVLVHSNLKSQNDVFGKWQTVDENSGKVTSIVEIFEKNEKLYGQIVKVIPAAGEEEDPLCKECTDFRKDKKINGMLIVSGLTFKKDVWSGGKILDPDNGKEYDCKIWLEEGKLKVRGYISFIYRTQTWLPFNE